MKALKINGQDVSMPTSWFEVTVSQYRKLLKAEGLTSQLEALSGIPALEWENLREIDFEQHIQGTISFLNEPVDLSGLPVPKHIKVGEQPIIVPQDLTIEVWGQILSLKTELGKVMVDNSTEAYLEAVVFAVAVYLSPKPYSDTGAREFVKELDSNLITEVFPTGNFFFRSWIGSQQENLNTSLSTLSQNKSGRGSDQSGKHSKNLEPLTPSQEVTY